MKAPLFMRLWGTPVTGPLISRLKITDPEKRRRQVFPLLVAHPDEVPLEFIELDIAAEALPGAGRNGYILLRAIGTFRGLRPELLMHDTMPTLHVPTLFLWGEADAFAPPSTGRQLAAAMPGARLDVVSDCGHLPHVERPEVVAAAINEFLDA
jgi:pimeloyl-ACP methyl ester carboxylesterase